MASEQSPGAQIQFDERVARQLDAVYRSRDALRRRELARRALSAQPGEHVVDVGCGTGFYVRELLDEVGPEGTVTGVDNSPQMLAMAAERCAGHPNAAFAEGEATALPVADAACDRALTVQVLEYVPDVAPALAELHRILRPGGRLLVWDVDWATVSMASRDAALTDRMLAAWDEHLVHRALPRTLSPALRAAGFEEVVMEGHAFTTNTMDVETYGGYMVEFIARYAVANTGITQEEADAWQAEQRELDERGEFYFAVIQFCFTATRGA